MLRKHEKIFVVYQHINPETGSIFYIGMGIPGRENKQSCRSRWWSDYVSKYGFKSEVLYSELTWAEACVKEKELIKKYGRQNIGTGILINMTNGGDGSGGHVSTQKGKKKPSPSDETRKLLSERNPRYWKGKTIPQEIRDRIAKKLTGQKPSPETLEKLKKRIPWNKGKKGVQQSTRKGKKFKPLSDEHKIKISLANKGKKRDAAFSEKMSKIHKGKINSQETKNKIRNTLLSKQKNVCNAA